MKNFDEIFEKIYNSSYQELENARKEATKKSNRILLITLVIFIPFALIFLFNGKFDFFKLFFLFFFGTFAYIIASIIMMFTSQSSYTKIYKNTVIKKLVKEYDNGLDYDQNSSIPAHIYKEAQFESYDNYYSDDLIYGKLDNKIPIQLGDVRTEDESTDSDGNTTTTTVFRGLFSKVTLSQNINTIIRIRSDKGLLGKFLKSKELMQMDSQEFEKNFDVYTQNKITAMQILTSDILDYMLTFKKENKINFELTLKNQELYIRIHCQNMFEATSIRKNSLDKKAIYLYYQYLDFLCELNKKFYNVIEEKNI